MMSFPLADLVCESLVAPGQRCILLISTISFERRISVPETPACGECPRWRHGESVSE